MQQRGQLLKDVSSGCGSLLPWEGKAVWLANDMLPSPV